MHQEKTKFEKKSTDKVYSTTIKERGCVKKYK